MAGKKAAGENSKKAAGNARKADTAARKQADKDAVEAAAEDDKWSKGAKSNAKKDAAEDKRRKLQESKAAKAALEAEEAASLPSKPVKSGGKSAAKKTSAAAPPSRGTLDLSKLDDDGPSAALNASGLDDALDALKITSRTQDKIDKHPERRLKAAFLKYKEAREGSDDFQGLNRSQREQAIKKEFDKSPENPMNQLHGSFNSTKTDMATMRADERANIEKRLAAK
ncbi:DUF1014-domain-containing protein [Xylona heveae TC161]|uniref:DUF1014-domain-containing protein n=1 Tax=Xylona heveae (strain CBS 132557 / TC161) TaxID=1328760 RepID=A0A165INC5_XYLHT|nr:DUF1014-domain-containing protein [Xylona heveae TC161]KZF25148.1 DUF1014-domain-containing protein [Xylona heveae TC161]